MDLSGYYRPDPAKMEAAMRPLQTFNEACPLFSATGRGTRVEQRRGYDYALLLDPYPSLLAAGASCTPHTR
jgi:hypothetical protein